MNVICAADYIAKSPGAFIDSLKRLGYAVTSSGGRIGFLFSAPRIYQKELEKVGPVFICDGVANKRFSFIAILKTLQMCHFINADIIHIHFVGMSFLIAACCAKIVYGCRVIVHWRNPPVGARPQARIIHRLSPYIYRFLNYVFIDLNITISRSIADVLIDRNYAPRENVKVVHNGIDLNRYCINHSINYPLIERKLNRHIQGRAVLGMVANFSRQKDHVTLLDAVRVVKKEFPDVLLILVGSEKLIEGQGYYALLKAHIDKAGLQDNVVLAGEWYDVAEIISCFDIGLLLSDFEGFGNAIVEYMAMRKPVIGTNIGGIAEIVEKRAGFLVAQKNPQETAQRILQLLRNPLLRQEMGRFGRKIVEERFSIAQWSVTMQGIYSMLLDGQQH